jgi:hypothetical protein
MGRDVLFEIAEGGFAFWRLNKTIVNVSEARRGHRLILRNLPFRSRLTSGFGMRADYKDSAIRFRAHAVELVPVKLQAFCFTPSRRSIRSALTFRFFRFHHHSKAPFVLRRASHPISL